jgi:osmoprotectant transport system ATP-binding protein
MMIRFKGVWKTFPPNHTVLEDFNLEIREGETLVILGKSGSGKTTALQLINRLIDPTKGEVFVGKKTSFPLTLSSLEETLGMPFKKLAFSPI